MHHEVDAITVTWDQVKRGDIPADFGAIALVLWGGHRHRIGAWPEVPVIRRWVSIGRDSNCGWGPGLVNCLDRRFPCPEDLGWWDARATRLPVASKLVTRARRHAQVCNEERWEHWPARRVGTPLGLCRTDLWVHYTSRVCEQGRNRVIRGGGPA
jgi:hypothetical protein